MPTDQTQAPDAGTGGGHRPVRWVSALLVAVIAVAALLAGGGLAVALGIGRTDSPAVGSVDAGFAQDMSRHHLQAVQMANLALERSTDPEVRQLAFDISATQTNQTGRMQGWLSLWGLPVTNRDTMSWMGHAAHDHAEAEGGLMPGMATQAELAQLRQLSGTAFDIRFLQLMTRHHQGGLEMAVAAADHASVGAVRGLARSIADTQAVESTTMAAMLAARGAAPLPAP